MAFFQSRIVQKLLLKTNSQQTIFFLFFQKLFTISAMLNVIKNPKSIVKYLMTQLISHLNFILTSVHVNIYFSWLTKTDNFFNDLKKKIYIIVVLTVFKTNRLGNYSALAFKFVSNRLRSIDYLFR
jgi:hypothetical protein